MTTITTITTTSMIPSSEKSSKSGLAECKAWGDPHVITFDGAQNDVYGVGTYIFSQTKTGIFPKFRVLMETEKWRNTAIVKAVEIEFYENEKDFTTYRLDRFGNAEYGKPGIKKYPTNSLKTDLWEIIFLKIGRQMTIQTNDIFLTMEKNKFSLQLSNSKLFESLEGLCGNNDGDEKNDYETSYGVTLPYESKGFKGFKRSESLGFSVIIKKRG